MAIDLNKTMRPAEIDIANEINKQGTQLFSGAWQEGTSITVANLDKYILFAVFLTNENVPILVNSMPTWANFRGCGGVITSTPRGYLYSCDAARSGNKLTLRKAAYQRIDNHAVTATTVSEIWGLI